MIVLVATFKGTLKIRTSPDGECDIEWYPPISDKELERLKEELRKEDWRDRFLRIIK